MTTSRLSSQVVYLDAAARLRDAIHTGVYLPGRQLPSELHLARTCDCGRDAIRAALAVLRRELLITTSRGNRATVCLPPDRITIPLPPGAVVTARMPLYPELPALGCRPEMPLLTVTSPDRSDVLYPADQAQLVVSH